MMPNPWGAAITWKDGRADAWATTRVDTARRALMYGRTGMPIDGRYLAPHAANITSPAASPGCAPFYPAKDYLLSELTGLRLTEPLPPARGLRHLRSERAAIQRGSR